MSEKNTAQKIEDFLKGVDAPDKPSFAEQMKGKRDDYTKMVEEKLHEAMTDGAFLKTVLSVAERFPERSTGNIVAIAAQNPKATFLQSKPTWNKQRIKVKGDGVELLTKGDSYLGNDKQIHHYYDVEKQYDVLETDVKPPKRDIQKNRGKEALKALGADFPCQIVFHPDLPVDSVYGKDQDTVFVSESLKSQPDKALIAVVSAMSERGQYLDNREGYVRDERVSFTAFCTAHIVAEHYGVKTDKLTLADNPQFESPDDVKAAIGTGRRQAKKICERIEREIEKSAPQKQPKESSEPEA